MKKFNDHSLVTRLLSAFVLVALLSGIPVYAGVPAYAGIVAASLLGVLLSRSIAAPHMREAETREALGRALMGVRLSIARGDGELRALTMEVNIVSDAVATGDVARRGDAEKFSGAYRVIVECMNLALDAAAGANNKSAVSAVQAVGADMSERTVSTGDTVARTSHERVVAGRVIDETIEGLRRIEDVLTPSAASLPSMAGDSDPLSVRIRQAIELAEQSGLSLKNILTGNAKIVAAVSATRMP